MQFKTVSPSNQCKLILYVSHYNYNFIIILHINSLQTCELHMQPLLHSINSIDFTIQYELLLYIILMFYNFSKHSLRDPWWWCRSTKTWTSICNIIQYCNIYRVSQEECARLWEGVPYVKVYRYNPKHLCPKLNGYRDNGQRILKLWQLLHTYWLPNTY